MCAYRKHTGNFSSLLSSLVKFKPSIKNVHFFMWTDVQITELKKSWVSTVKMEFVLGMRAKANGLRHLLKVYCILIFCHSYAFPVYGQLLQIPRKNLRVWRVLLLQPGHTEKQQISTTQVPATRAGAGIGKAGRGMRDWSSFLKL